MIALQTRPAADAQQRPKSILVVDDDADLRVQIARYLGAHGFEVTVAADAAELRAAFGVRPPDLVVLDVMLPGEDGLAICRSLARQGGPPVIMLSAMGEAMDRIVGLEVGADDYIPKPCSPRELLARIRAVLRRRGEASSGASATGSGSPISVLVFDGFELNFMRRRLLAPDGSVVVLSANEFALLAGMAERPREIVDRTALARLAGIGDSADDSRAVDMLISRLRRKLQAHCDHEIIATRRGRGYGLNATSVRGGALNSPPIDPRDDGGR